MKGSSNALRRAIPVDPFTNVTQRKNKSKTNQWIISQEIVMLYEIKKEDTSPSVRSLRFPKLQIFVEMVCVNLQSSDRALYGAAMLVSLRDTLFFLYKTSNCLGIKVLRQVWTLKSCVLAKNNCCSDGVSLTFHTTMRSVH